MLNAIMNRSYDFEVMSYAIGDKTLASHHAATLVPTAIALAEAKNASGKELLTAMIVGDDIAARVQGASEAHPIGRGWDGCGTLSHLGAVATAGRLLGLNPRQMRHAFGVWSARTRRPLPLTDCFSKKPMPGRIRAWICSCPGRYGSLPLLVAVTAIALPEGIFMRNVIIGKRLALTWVVISDSCIIFTGLRPGLPDDPY